MTESYTLNCDTAEVNRKVKYVGKNLCIYIAESCKNLYYCNYIARIGNLSNM